MSQETLKDIESEIGHNGWRLVGKIGVVVSGIVAVPTMTGLIWIGAIDNQVAANERAVMALTARVTASETSQAMILERTTGIRDQIGGLLRRLDSLPSSPGGRP